MTYGVDECRVCGKAMKPKGPEAMQRYLASLKAKPTMTPQQWRAAGLKAAPTKRQTWSLHDGCCFDCALVMGTKSVGQKRWIYPMLIIVAVCVSLLLFIGSRYT